MEQLARDEFTHVRIIIGMVTGLSVTRLLTGLARLVQHPGKARVYWAHLGWTLFLLLAVMHFWWFEFGLLQVRWTFQVYAFTMFYAALFFFTCAVLTPDALDDYAGIEAYFYDRRAWFFGLLAALFAADLADTAIKGAEHLRALGPGYPVRQGLLILGAGVAAVTADRRYHAAFLAAALAGEVYLIATRYDLLA